MEYNKPSTWVTVFASVMEYRGLYGYSYYVIHDAGNKSKIGVFKGKLTDYTHAKFAAIGSALKLLKTDLKEYPIAGITINTDDVHIYGYMNDFIRHGSIATSDKNLAYVIGVNRLLSAIPCKRWDIRKQSAENVPDWLKSAIFNRLKAQFVDEQAAKPTWRKKPDKPNPYRYSP